MLADGCALNWSRLNGWGSLFWLQVRSCSQLRLYIDAYLVINQGLQCLQQERHLSQARFFRVTSSCIEASSTHLQLHDDSVAGSAVHPLDV